jgi:hypothetical protein
MLDSVDFVHLLQELLIGVWLMKSEPGPGCQLSFDVRLPEARVEQVDSAEVIGSADQSADALVDRSHCFRQVPLTSCEGFLTRHDHCVEVVHFGHYFHVFSSGIGHAHQHNCSALLVRKVEPFGYFPTNKCEEESALVGLGLFHVSLEGSGEVGSVLSLKVGVFALKYSCQSLLSAQVGFSRLEEAS